MFSDKIFSQTESSFEDLFKPIVLDLLHFMLLLPWNNKTLIKLLMKYIDKFSDLFLFYYSVFTIAKKNNGFYKTDLDQCKYS